MLIFCVLAQISTASILNEAQNAPSTKNRRRVIAYLDYKDFTVLTELCDRLDKPISEAVEEAIIGHIPILIKRVKERDFVLHK
jgi:hypothetical protein